MVLQTVKELEAKNNFFYTLGEGAVNSNGGKFWASQEAIITLNICCKFQKDCFELWFYIDFFMILYMYIAPGQGQITSDDKISNLI